MPLASASSPSRPLDSHAAFHQAQGRPSQSGPCMRGCPCVVAALTVDNCGLAGAGPPRTSVWPAAPNYSQTGCSHSWPTALTTPAAVTGHSTAMDPWPSSGRRCRTRHGATPVDDSVQHTLGNLPGVCMWAFLPDASSARDVVRQCWFAAAATAGRSTAVQVAPKRANPSSG